MPMGQGEKSGALRAARLLILGVLAVLFVGGMSVVVLAIARSGEPALVRPGDALAGSDDDGVGCPPRPPPPTARCATCHASEVAQYYQSRHSLPAHVAFAGTADLTPEQLALFEAVPEGGFAPDQMRNALFALPGPAVTRFACEMCHNVGRPQADGPGGGGREAPPG